jgi:DNA-binding response OmpR family regulator
MTGRRIDENALTRTVLVVEDDVDVAEMLVAVLEELHCQTLHAPDSYQALTIARDVQPDLLLLDYHLPDINGLELYDRLTAIEGLQGMPTLFISANPPISELQKRRLPYLKKPFELDEFLAKVEMLIYQRVEITTYQYISTAHHC